MNKFTKISATALFALFLTACDKPVDKAATPAKAESSQTQTAPKAEEAKTTETVSSDQQALNDFNTLMQWKQVQEQKFAIIQKELEQYVTTENKDKLTEALDMFNSKVSNIVKELEALEIKSPEINTFKQKAYENLTLLNDLIVESVKAMHDPKPELQATIQEKTDVLKKSTDELRQIQSDLEQKYLKKQ